MDAMKIVIKILILSVWLPLALMFMPAKLIVAGINWFATDETWTQSWAFDQWL